MTPDAIRPRIHDKEPGVHRELSDKKTLPTAEWAQNVWNNFQRQPIGKIKDRKRTINGLRKELARATITPEGIPQHLVHDPKSLEEAFSAWVARSDPRNERSGLFLETAQGECNEYARKNWKRITDTELGQLLSVTAHTTLATEPLTGVLKSYFAGPGIPEERVDAVRNLASGVLDLVADAKGFEFGTRIVSFHTDILPPDSEHYVDIDIASANAIDNLPLLEKAMQASVLFEGLRTIVGRKKFDMKSIVKDMKLSSLFSQRVHEYSARLRGGAIPRNQMTERLEQIESWYLSKGQLFEVRTEDSSMIVPPPEDSPIRWLFDLTIGTKDPLVKKYGEMIGSRVRSIQLAERMPELGYGIRTYETGEVASIPVGNNIILDVCIPVGYDLGKRTQLMQSALESFRHTSEDLGGVLFRDPGFKSIASHSTLITSFEFNGTNVNFIVRETTKPERENLHDLARLLSIGFPVPEIPEQQSTQEAIQKLQDDIKKYQRRFLNRRGIRVGFYNPQITERGYSHVDFQRGDEPGVTKVRLYHENKPYEVKLDKNHNLDFEGKTMVAPQFEESLHYYLLTILKDYFCKEALESSEGTIVDREGLVQARIPHLRLLRPGHSSGLDQRQAYLEEQGGDLIAKSEERKVLLGTDRNTTYVRAVVKEEDETLEPITVHIDAV